MKPLPLSSSVQSFIHDSSKRLSLHSLHFILFHISQTNATKKTRLTEKRPNIFSRWFQCAGQSEICVMILLLRNLDRYDGPSLV